LEWFVNYGQHLKEASTISLRDVPLSSRFAVGTLLGLTLFMIWDQHYWWKLRDEYAFGFIVPLFVAYVIFERWPKILSLWKPAEPRESAQAGWFSIVLQVTAALMVAGGALLFLLGAMYRAMEGQNLITSNFFAFGYANLLLGLVFLYANPDAHGRSMPLKERWQLTMVFLFPALIWMLSVPMFSAVYDAISMFLMNQVAVVVYYSFDVLGYAVVREGSVLRLPLGDVGVEDACSGIRSLTACLFAGSFLGAVYFKQLWKKVFLVGTAMFFAFINNIFRSLFLTAWAYAKGPTGLDGHVYLFGMDLGNVHDFTGWVVLGLTVICLLILVKLFSIEFETPIEDQATAT
jgi:exosortase